MSEIVKYSVFGEYVQPENRVTAAFLHLLNIGGHKLVSYIFQNKIKDFPQNELAIITQRCVKDKDNNKLGIADGEIYCDYKFRIQIECKLNGDINEEQLNRYKQRLAEGITLIYIVGNANKKGVALQNIPYFTWSELSGLLSSYMSDFDDIGDVEIYLIKQFLLMLENLKLVDHSFERVIVVGGIWGEDVAKRYHFYACQNNRFFRGAKYLAFYWNNRIECMYEIIGEPQDNMNLKDKTLNIPQEYFQTKEPDYKEATLCKVFVLGETNLLKRSIINDTRSKSGRRCAFTQNQRYVTFDSIINAQFTSELETMD